MFKQIYGQDRVIKLLSKTIKNNRIAQAYLFFGPDGVGKFTTALYFGMALNCLAAVDKRPCGVCNPCHKFLEFVHPDLFYVFPIPNMEFNNEGELQKKKDIEEYLSFIEKRKTKPWEKHYFSSNTMIRIETIRKIESRLNYSINEARYRICIIEEADQMNKNTFNAFLKTLEEPPHNTVIILTTHNYNALSPTIVSRCQPIYFSMVSAEMIENCLVQKHFIEPLIAKKIAKIANGNLELAIRLCTSPDDDIREQVINIFNKALTNDDYGFLTFLNHNKEKLKTDYLTDFLSYILIFFNDLVVLRYHPQLISNVDQLNLFNACLLKISDPEISIAKTILSIQDLQVKVTGNVNNLLILNQLFFLLKKLFNPN